ncbi:MAG: hypothetical protein E7385_05930 [Ruminococcaceae bacterium]|nr:hypothetical protein [Oscillospiraceae bacterium]
MRKLVSLILTIIISVSVLSVVSMAEDKTLILSESFDQYADNNEAYNELSKNWLLEDGANTSWPDYFNLIENGNGKALSMTWVGARRMLLTGKYIPSDYEVSFKMKTEYTTPNGGFFSMHTMVDLPYVTQKWDDATQTIVPFWGGIPNYEADGHSDPLIANGVGYAGVYIKPERNKLEIGVKTAEIPSATAKYGIGNIRYFVDLPDGKDFGTELLQVRITDKDNIISVYVDDTLLATVTYGNISGLFYKNASIKDANGNVVASTENARICIANDLGFVLRGAILVVDDFDLYAYGTFAPALSGTVPLYNTQAEKTGLKGILGDESMAVKIDVASKNAISSFTYKGMATYACTNTEATFYVYPWNNDYQTTLTGTPIYTNVIYNHINNMDCVINFDTPITEGSYLFVLTNGKAGIDENGAAGGQPVVWLHEKNAESTAQFYINGEISENAFYADYELLTGYPEKVVEPENPTTPSPTEKPADPTQKPSDPTQGPVENPPTGEAMPVFGLTVLVLTSVVAVLYIFSKTKRTEQ